MTATGRSKTKAAAALAVVFLLGMVTGAAAWHVGYARNATDTFDAASRGSRYGVFVWSLERKLDLTSQQKQSIEAIMARYERDTAAVAPPPDPRITALREQMRADIRALLDARQQKRFGELISELDAVKKRDRAATSASAASPSQGP
jgi:hypothetical protein